MFTVKELRIILSAFNQVPWSEVKGSDKEKGIIYDKLLLALKKEDK